VACTYGRPKLTKDQDRQLFSESAGTCLVCSAPLFGTTSSGRSLSIAERAHIVAHAENGPRGDSTVTAAFLSDPANIVLLCPTCHTTVDQDPAGYPVHLLLDKKVTRAAAVARVGGLLTFSTRHQARRAVEEILDRNAALFEALGPNPADGSTESPEAAAKWSQAVLEDIVPGNELIVAMVALNFDVANHADRTAAEALRIHARDLGRKHREGILVGPALRFPRVAVDIFAGEL